MRFRLLPEIPELGWTPYLWLVYLAFFLFDLIEASALERTLSLVAVPVFLVLYFRGFWIRGWRLLPIVLAIAALGIGFLPFNPGASVFFIYAASLLGFMAPPRQALLGLLLLLGVLGLESWGADVPPEGWIPGVVFSVLVGFANIHFAEALRKRVALQEARQELARLGERERIARDLHDLLGHTLSLITLKAELAAKLATRDPGRAVAEIRAVEAISRRALAEVRAAVRGYRRRGLVRELENGRLALEAAGIRLEQAVEAELPVTPEQEQALALSLREAVTNVVRHSRASRCTVRLFSSRDRVCLEVRDDGCGSMAPEGSGLTGMRERVAALGGRCEHWNDRGLALRVTLPRHRSARAAEDGKPLPAVPAIR